MKPWSTNNNREQPNLKRPYTTTSLVTKQIRRIRIALQVKSKIYQEANVTATKDWEQVATRPKSLVYSTQMLACG